MAIGYLYILFNPSLRSDLFKIGKTTRDPRLRARELSQTSGVPEPYEVLFTRRVEACEIAERLVHSLLARYRRFRNREFFCMPLEQAIEAVQRACELTDNLMDDGLFEGQL
ncbi:MAG: GIY-YIG nuclease family protein [Alphaproteobacteria bacterium]